MEAFIPFSTSIIFYFCIKFSVGAPVANTSTLDGTAAPLSSTPLVGYVDDPNRRGTSSLVISCLLTLVLCVWSALHLNVPRRADTRLHCLVVNIRWIITGIYAPELVVFTAWRQWSSAKILGNLVRNLDNPSHNNQVSSPNAKYQATDNDSCDTANSHNPSESSTRRHQWTMTHDFFASTGGFVFEIEDDESVSEATKLTQFLPPSCPRRLTITARGMALLAKCGRLPDIPKEDILDKSKANDLAKALVMIQAAWMLLQVLGRLIAGLPVTLLEVNTIAHVLCAFLMYIMWWHKPLSPNEPFVLKGHWVNSLCAYMYMSSEMSGEVYERSVVSQTMVKSMFAFLHLYSKSSEMENLCFSRCQTSEQLADPGSDPARTDILSQAPGGSQVSDSNPRAFRLTSKKSFDELRSKILRKATGTAFFERRPRIKAVQSPMTTNSTITQHRWRLAALAVESYPVLQKDYVTQVQHPNYIYFKSEELVVLRVQNWPWDDLLRNVGGLVVGFVLWLANFAYGAIHAAAWNDHFPTAAEKWLWRSSSVYIGFCGGLWIVLNYVAQAYRPLNEFWERWMDGGGKKWQNILIGIPVAVCGFSLLFARGFIVVEAFISIRQLPAAAYDTPTWSQIFPHF